MVLIYVHVARKTRRFLFSFVDIAISISTIDAVGTYQYANTYMLMIEYDTGNI